jgi:hypothetical protein
VLSERCRNIRSLRFQFFAERYTNRYFDFDLSGLAALLEVNRKIHTLDLENAGFLSDENVIEIAKRIPSIKVLNLRFVIKNFMLKKQYGTRFLTEEGFLLLI